EDSSDSSSDDSSDGSSSESDSDEDTEVTVEETPEDNMDIDSENSQAPEELQPIDAKHAIYLDKFKNVAEKLQLSIFKTEKRERAQAILGETKDESSDADEDANTVKAGLIPFAQPAELLGDQDITNSNKNKDNFKSTLKWFVDPIYVSNAERIPFSTLGLHAKVLKNLTRNGFVESFAVQTAVLPLLLKDIRNISPDKRSDILANAATGSGKTLAYVVPIVESLIDRVVPRTRAIIILPTKVLIQQVRQVFEMISSGFGLNILTLRSERAFKDEQDVLTRFKPDVVICTPGRLVDHLRSGTEGLKNLHKDLKWLVIDEADRLLNQSFQEWVDVIINAIEKNTNTNTNTTNNETNNSANNDSIISTIDRRWKTSVQKLIYSATLTRDPGKLSGLKIHEPKVIIVADNDIMNDKEFTVPESLSENLVPIKSSSVKPLHLFELIWQENLTSDVLIFTNSNESAARLTRLLNIMQDMVYGLSETTSAATATTEQNGSAARKRILREFSKGQINIVVGTDLIARGLDIASIRHVINYDLPTSKREYVHRVGRTARANHEGRAWSLACSRSEHKWFWKISNSIHR
ncbi:P-loop containing nucleoside triphosphate hydrolase protein, partial [Nadsonia fulvescens var. elongata DSM 6958]